jgi:hypothetical protein
MLAREGGTTPGGGMVTPPSRVAASPNVLATAPREAVLRAEIRRVEAEYAVRGGAGWLVA